MTADVFDIPLPSFHESVYLVEEFPGIGTDARNGLLYSVRCLFEVTAGCQKKMLSNPYAAASAPTSR